MCPGITDLFGHGQVAVTATDFGKGSVVHLDENSVTPHMGARAYFAETCTDGSYANSRYSAINLLGKTMRFKANLSGADCGCNVAVYLVSMRQNTRPSKCDDYYCDANAVCGVYCSEIDIMEANRFAWHSTLHSSKDGAGKGGGYGGGLLDFSSEQYGPGAECVDTLLPFQVAVSFPTKDGSLGAMEVTLTQDGKGCPLTVTLAEYEGMAELSGALADGMTPVISYWESKDLLWLDGKGADKKGPCTADTQKCAESVKLFDFAIEELPLNGAPPASAVQPRPPATPPPPGPSLTTTTTPAECADFGADCRASHCCRDSGLQCYEKNPWWASCKESCIPGFGLQGEDTAWTCTPLGPRTTDHRKQEHVVLEFAPGDVPPAGSEITIVDGRQYLRAKVMEEVRQVTTTTLQSHDHRNPNRSRGGGGGGSKRKSLDASLHHKKNSSAHTVAGAAGV